MPLEEDRCNPFKDWLKSPGSKLLDGSPRHGLSPWPLLRKLSEELRVCSCLGAWRGGGVGRSFRYCH